MNAIDRAVSILNKLAGASKPCGVTEISKELNLSKSAVYRILSSLKRAQWVTQDSDSEKYTLGLGLIEFGVCQLARLEIRSVSQPYLQELRNVTRETATLSLRSRYDNIILDQLTPSHDFLYLIPLGTRLPLWLGAMGKVILTFLPKSEIEIVMDTFRKVDRKTYDSGEPINIENIQQQLAKVEEEGFLAVVGERVAGAIAIAAPIFSHGHEVIGSIAVVAPVFRLPEERARQYGALIKEVAKKISLRLGDVE